VAINVFGKGIGRIFLDPDSGLVSSLVVAFHAG
jgi:hypothetical protein